MGRVSLKDRLRQGLFLLDGAMGTQLIAYGVEPGKCSELLNIESPGLVMRIHKAYLHAGSDAVLTNTFGGNGFALARHGLANRVMDVNTTGAHLARKAAGRTKYVLGDIGPAGDFLEPLGSLKPDQLTTVFADQAKALLAGGVDGFIIETMSAIEEAAIAVRAAKSAGSDLPVLASMSFDKRGPDFKTMMGVDVNAAVSALVSAGADAVGFNCGTVSLDEYVELAEKFVSAMKTLENTRATSHERRATIFAEPNAGKPELVDGKAVYKVTPDEFASAAQKIYAAGVTIIGGCCGSTPEHIHTLAKKLRG
ncbi:MAG: homocysteine S-methyltransferase family protein [Sedimentisphaerales bacterium]|nr:homocysteine S-methyltransferase family protein [Sedimentisphaerales bacterium]